MLSDGTNAYLRVTLKNLVPTFGSLDGAQLLDVYVHVPGASATSTQAAYASRNYTIAPAGAWSQRVEVQGFAPPVWVNACGNERRHRVRARQAVGPDDHGGAARGPVRHPGVWVGLQRRADRPGRLQPRPGARVHRDPRCLHVRGVRAGGTAPICSVTRPRCRRLWT